MLSPSQVNDFHQQGYLLLRDFIPKDIWQPALEIAKQHLVERVKPFELESELQYPGAPSPEQDPERVIRRLLQAADRDQSFYQCATHSNVVSAIEQLLNNSALLVRAHHNCIMTKQPAFSSDSWWHQDIRYWKYSKGNLISAWFALGAESSDNGGLMVIPGSHKEVFSAEQFDSKSFFRQDIKQNQTILKQKVHLNLDAGDLLLFHCRLLHAATRNYTEATKLAAVFTYREEYDCPVPNSRSASLPDVRLDSE
ncbi:phytanoyl-CoA dioxygenase family protein [Pleionea litopenaei]|uniref:Phytanoyl-CoA dioxygenase family protein n=1 Tax=Pleionea litopenaei TaxID=3070815 RepID=A0AA51RVI9_9GAMM|nr:phytanoyl-CoA dioxygenase family protein [Pleionea sp. HL-JVS1]WMS88244.1 phytanoyl-CoA dioxygenase family protein [Pleionea sp. HL-JVS1]